MRKRLVVCCDGTWNRRDQPNPTNVTKIHAAVAPADDQGSRQVPHYVPGVGTAWWEKIRGGMFGMGLSRGVMDAYRWIAQNYEPDDELFLFGFSRGAYTARSTAGLIRNCGILRQPTEDHIQQAYSLYRSDELPDGPNATAFRTAHSHPLASIRFIGVWDTVGSLGVPVGDNRVTRWINQRWGFHDTDLSSYVENAFHALAVDEARRPYSPTLWSAPEYAPAEQRVEQVWFSGAHSDVGGGFAETGLSDLALLWMAEQAETCGLAFSPDALTPGQPPRDVGMPMPIHPDPFGPLHNTPKGLFRLIPRSPRTGIGTTVRGRESIAASAVIRTEADTTYRPSSLLDAIAGQLRQVPLPHRASASRSTR